MDLKHKKSKFQFVVVKEHVCLSFVKNIYLYTYICMWLRTSGMKKRRWLSSEPWWWLPPRCGSWPGVLWMESGIWIVIFLATFFFLYSIKICFGYHAVLLCCLASFFFPFFFFIARVSCRENVVAVILFDHFVFVL